MIPSGSRDRATHRAEAALGLAVLTFVTTGWRTVIGSSASETPMTGTGDSDTDRPTAGMAA
jgi:hypothetical protein